MYRVTKKHSSKTFHADVGQSAEENGWRMTSNTGTKEDAYCYDSKTEP